MPVLLRHRSAIKSDAYPGLPTQMPEIYGVEYCADTTKESVVQVEPAVEM